MKGRFRRFLRASVGKDKEGRSMINIPIEIIKELEWDINDFLKIDIVSSGMEKTIRIVKEKK